MQIGTSFVCSLHLVVWVNYQNRLVVYPPQDWQLVVWGKLPKPLVVCILVRFCLVVCILQLNKAFGSLGKLPKPFGSLPPPRIGSLLVWVHLQTWSHIDRLWCIHWDIIDLDYISVIEVILSNNEHRSVFHDIVTVYKLIYANWHIICL